MPVVLMLLLLLALPVQSFAEACTVHSHSDKVDVKICEQNVNIPSKMFHDGFCQPKLKDQKVDVQYSQQCPAGAYGVCRGLRSPGTPFSQDTYYYGVASDAPVLKLSCEKRSHGKWGTP